MIAWLASSHFQLAENIPEQVSSWQTGKEKAPELLQVLDFVVVFVVGADGVEPPTYAL